MSIYYNKRCPICQGELIKSLKITYYYTCQNNCYTLSERFSDVYIRIFDKQYQIEKSSTLLVKIKARNIEKNIQKQITYWKENDRYLTKILEGDI